MLSELRIRGLGVIDEAVIELSPGLNVLTGETGAGKTMVVTALALLMGERADAGLVRSGADQLAVEGWWQVPAASPVFQQVEEAGGSVEAGEELVTARLIGGSGRSRAMLGGRGVPAATLASVAESLVAVHGQSDQWRLTRPAAQREVVDRFGGDELAAARDRVAELVGRWRALRAEIAGLAAADRQALQRAEVLRAGLAAIEEVDPQVEEAEELRAREERLAHADELSAAADSLHSALTGERLDGTAEESSVAALLASARAAIAPAVTHDETLAGFDARARELAYLTTDLAADVAAHAAGIESDPMALAAVQERRAQLGSLLRRYGDSVQEVLDWSRDAAAELYLIDTADERLAAAEQELGQVETALGEALRELTSRRVDASERLAKTATAELAHLAMGRARLHVEVRSLAPDGDDVLETGGKRVAVHRHGCDEIELMLQANPGAAARPLAKAASGGELSRVMLALELVTGGEVPTYVFDEVDAGVGGASAVDVGARLARLAATAQVVVVTHLPQVAAFADRHLTVRKSSDGQITSSDVTALDGAEREAELARMLGGSETQTAIEHARELLERSRSELT